MEERIQPKLPYILPFLEQRLSTKRNDLLQTFFSNAVNLTQLGPVVAKGPLASNLLNEGTKTKIKHMQNLRPNTSPQGLKSWCSQFLFLDEVSSPT